MKILKKAFYIVMLLFGIVLILISVIFVLGIIAGFCILIWNNIGDTTVGDVFKAFGTVIIYMAVGLLLMHSPDIIKWSWRNLKE